MDEFHIPDLGGTRDQGINERFRCAATRLNPDAISRRTDFSACAALMHLPVYSSRQFTMFCLLAGLLNNIKACFDFGRRKASPNARNMVLSPTESGL